MKNKFDNVYFKWSLALFSVIGSSILLYFFILRVDNVIKFFGKILYILKPVIYGFIIAFLLTQIYNFFDKRFARAFSKRKNSRQLAKIFSITISILILLLILFFIFYILIPKTIVSILAVIEAWPQNMENIENWLRDVLKSSPVLEEQILSMVNESSNSIIEWLSTGIVPQMEKITDSVTTGLNDIYIFLKDFIVGIVFSIYIVSNKNKFLAVSKKLIYTIFGIKRGNGILEVGRYSNKIFNGFVKGKLITSLIIGLATYIGMIIFNLPYALLISVIVAVTNIIPFFGPLIGWVPSVILVLLSSPLEALYFTILCIILQQIEGNILEPKIVGKGTGISGFWVLFAIIVFEGLFGFVGMIIGVPIFAIIYHFVVLYINGHLNKKDIPTDYEDYIDLKYIDETTKKPIKTKSL